MADNSTMDNNSESEITSPGRFLQAQREKLELTAQDIAKRIHLDIKIVEAIEADKHEKLPSAIYVRGYLRSYAKIVDIDAEKIISLYNADSPPALPEILPEVKPPTQASSNDKPVKAFTYLISLGLVLLLLIWYQSNFVVETRQNSTQDIINATPDMINGVDTSYDIVIHPEGWQIPEYREDEDLTYPADTPASDIQNETLELQTDNGEETLGILPVQEINNTSSLSIATGQDSIVLKLTRDSWIEIVDANNERLFYDLALANERHIISGKAPFSVLFGFSEGVTVEFNGQPFDQSPYSNNGIARFTLPE